MILERAENWFRDNFKYGGGNNFIDMVNFCPKCDKILRVQKIDNEKKFFCRGCNVTFPYESQKTPKTPQQSKNIAKKIKKLKTVVVSEDDDSLGSITQLCPKCGNNKAYSFEMPPLWGDEESFIRYKCSKCRHVWQEGSVVSGH